MVEVLKALEPTDSISMRFPWEFRHLIQHPWSTNFDLIEKGVIRPIGSNIFAGKDVTFLLVHTTFYLGLTMSMLIPRTRLSVIVFHFNPNAFVIGCASARPLSRLIRLTAALSLLGMVSISSEELLAHFVKLKAAFLHKLSSILL